MQEVIKTDSIQVAKATDLMDFSVAQKVTETLNKHYPGYMWGVNVSSETGMVHVRNFSLSGIWGFNLHLIDVQEDVSGNLIKNAGGEILERFRVRVGKAKEHQVEELPTNAVGLIVPDAVNAK